MAAIDVVMPMRDAERWVGRAWESLARQTFRDWRLLAVDDGSRDRSAQVLSRAAGGDRRLLLVRAPRRGVAAALNRGLREVHAPVVVRMDADDLSHPRRLELLRAALEDRPEWGVAASRVRLFPRRAVTPTMGTYLDWQNGLLDPQAIRNERYVECTVTHASAAFRTGVLAEAGGWWEGDGPEDLDLFLRLHARGVRFGKLPRVLYWWREHGGRETRTSPRLSVEAFRRVKARHLAGEVGGRPVCLFGLGKSLESWRRALARAGITAAAREFSPRAPLPRWEGLALFCFGHPKARRRVRERLSGAAEGRDYLFVA
ncbi:MAG: hypothetical protein Kow0092_31740 [Deferrisomatales bacterium]